MATPTYATSTELDAVNSILMYIGESPVNTLNTKSPEVSIAQTTLHQVSREVQAEGWSFNEVLAVEFPVDSTTKQVQLGTNIIKVDTSRYHHLDTYNVTRRDNKLYDKYSHKDTFDEESTMYLDVVYMQDFPEIPQVFRDYIAIKAARVCVLRMVNDQAIAEGLRQDEIIARANAQEYDNSQADYNIFNDEQHKFAHRSFRPYQVLAR